ncbi:hypothetical protein KFU94_13400 [Chloroflexi bacterium TSY]|nr:hypothetical protein [Chloroflexi bacterium TSY]
MTKRNQRGSKSNRIDEELVCMDVCRHVLMSACNCVVPVPTRIDNDPPDFEMTVDGHLYPVEVTSIAVTKTIARHAQSKAFASLIQRQAIQKGILFGTYGLVFTRNIQPPQPNSAAGQQVLDEALSYIDGTQEDDECSAASLFTASNGGNISIKKGSLKGTAVGTAIIDAAQWGSETVLEIITLIQERVDEKLRTLANHNVPAKNTLLLLFDAHGYASVADIIEALQSVTNYTEFHSVFLAASFTERNNKLSTNEPGRDGVFLFSRNANWAGKTTI